MKPSVFLLSLASLACCAPSSGNGDQKIASRLEARKENIEAIGQKVKTSSGYVVGSRAPNATQVSQYLGIPFAYPPVGRRRFAPPEAFQGRDTIDATAYGHNCPSQSAPAPEGLEPPPLANLLTFLGQVGDDQQEDCLYLNVWTKPQSGSKKKPVLVWIYGGGFNTGGTNNTAYNGQHWADEEDVVFVNFNYRLNIFGFPGAPDLTQNVGLLDQRLAIEWVRDNIAAFGGDPKQITIFGESAGAASVDYYNYAYTKDPIIAGSIGQSGTAISFGNKLPSTAADNWFEVAERVGCNSSDNAQVLKCMRSDKVSMTDLITAENAGLSGLEAVLGVFGPTIDNKTVFSDYTALAQEGRFIRKPYMTGSNSYEAGLFILLTSGGNFTQPASFWETFNQNTFICPATTAAEFRARQNVPAWRYVYNPEFPNQAIPTSMGVAYHTAEILPMFGTSERTTKQDSTWQERAMGSYMREAWSAFAHNPSSGLDLAGWRRFDRDTASVNQLGFDPTDSTTFSVLPSFGTTAAYDEGCGMFPFMGTPNS
ncbi:cholinesterase [Hortaea werneckii]|uniref:Carboxylic ester hydrolase n=2 Tax=Hortaea werneckii TaxID=91943 RepID=A0A3M7JBD6_HORWE|nr:cholinesterase [Hortaea werneckii]OTA22414.1 hypothetical protein BTJ68_14471 [Hortaea werneckii EXF-2000]KAI6798792.1 cholinesterase [Hortaea werneckii]KAI6901669.1 cholinesterase [Hortaea werneckii]KAI6920908.1 cholinesterase [Hortaea werneckii]